VSTSKQIIVCRDYQATPDYCAQALGLSRSVAGHGLTVAAPYPTTRTKPRAFISIRQAASIVTAAGGAEMLWTWSSSVVTTVSCGKRWSA
jgi:hypothetical protein